MFFVTSKNLNNKLPGEMVLSTMTQSENISIITFYFYFIRYNIFYFFSFTIAYSFTNNPKILENC